MDKERVPSPDGFTLAYHRLCWDLVKENVMRVFNEFYANDILEKIVNLTFFTVVPKDHAIKVKDFRLISLPLLCLI